MSSKRTIALVVMTAFVALALTACGDDAEPLTKAEFIEQTDAICTASDLESEPILDEAFGDFEEREYDPQEFAARFDTAFDEVAPILQQQVDDIRELTPPADDAELIGTLLDDLEVAIADLAETVQAAAEGDAEALAAMEFDEDPLTDINTRAQDYGLLVCGSSE